MKRWTFLFAATVVCALATGTALAADKASPGDAILGKWWFPKKNGKMEIVRDGKVYSGKVVDYEDPDALDKNNPDPELAKRPFIGIEMLNDFVYDPDSYKWIDGTIYDGESGKTYKCSVWFENNDMSKLNVRGYVGVSLFGRTEIFTRVTKEDEEREAAEKKKQEEAAKANQDGADQDDEKDDQ